MAPEHALGSVRILALLGAGGMGEVIAATIHARGVTWPSDFSSRPAMLPEVRARFERDARAVPRYSHPHPCTLFDAGREGDTLSAPDRVGVSVPRIVLTPDGESRACSRLRLPDELFLAEVLQ